MSVVVRNWERFQHRDVVRAKQGRAPVWIKVYTELLSDEAFLSLSEHRRLVLICVWLEYARTRARLPLDTRSLSRRLQLRVTKADLVALNHAGFLELRPADGQQTASLEERRGEKNVLEESATSYVHQADDDSRTDKTPATPAPLGDLVEPVADQLAAHRARKAAGTGMTANGRPVTADGVLDRLRARSP